MRAPPVPLDDRQDFAFFTLMVKALTTPPPLSRAPSTRTGARPDATMHVPALHDRLAAWLHARARQVAGAAIGTGLRADPSAARAAPHPYY